ncbi:unnamed protein product [Toxocara canis]|uniref:WASH-7_N domain-containing protein n=1 Tax=Toxocara canis TaxID=6265 RepID=A0A183U6J2_TOXCA|nr:unnamed protein product [Toxocara canis]
MGDVLYSWAVRQQKVSIGTLWSQQAHYRLLDTIHQQFEYFGELLEQTMSGIRYIQDRYRHEAFDTVYLKLQQLAHYFLYYSIIVSRQPPSVVVKCGEAENHRRSRFWFNTEIRFACLCRNIKSGNSSRKGEGGGGRGDGICTLQIASL